MMEALILIINTFTESIAYDIVAVLYKIVQQDTSRLFMCIIARMDSYRVEYPKPLYNQLTVQVPLALSYCQIHNVILE